VIALGVVTPILFHAIGAGAVFLPMHLPVLVGAMWLSPSMAALVGALTPLVSAGLTGMPPIAPPIAVFMTFELAAIAFVASALHRTLARGIMTPWLVAFLATLGAILAGRLVYAAELFVVAPILGVSLPAAAAGAAALVKGLPGIALQLCLVPPIVMRVASGKGHGSAQAT
jgi:hypothetical protein